MYASDIQERNANRVFENRSRQTWMEHIGEGTYALAVYRLQNEAGLTFKEARATLLPIQLIKVLAEEWGCSAENVYNLHRKGLEKVWAVTGDDNEKIERLLPQRMCHIF